MRVGISTTSVEYHLTEGKRDGIGVYTDNLMSSLTRLDAIELERFYYPSSLLDVFWPRQDLATNRFHAPYMYCGMLSNVFGLPDINQRVIERKVDLYHATDYKIPKLGHTPVVATLYDAIPLKHPEWVSVRLRWLKNKVLVNSAKWADHVITISDHMVDDIENCWGVSREKISVVHCGVSKFWSHQQRAEEVRTVRQKHAIHKPYILFVGTFQPRKNISRVIDAFLALSESVKSEYQLVLVGREGWKSEELIRKISRLENSEQCVWVKDASDEDLRCLYQGASVFLFPSLSEGFGLPVLEAFASRIPVITSRDTALEEVAGDAAYLVDPYSLDEIVCALTEVLSWDDDTIDKVVQRGLERCEQFSWDSAANKIYGIYQKLL